MTDSAHLERRYRRLLAFYPKAFRREHQEEIISVLMAGAAKSQRRPRLAESVDLLRNGVFMRVRHTRLPTAGSTGTPVSCSRPRWHRYRLVVLTAILYGYGRGGWWGALLVPAAALHFYLAYRLRHRVQS